LDGNDLETGFLGIGKLLKLDTFTEKHFSGRDRFESRPELQCVFSPRAASITSIGKSQVKGQ
jgi:hypothetical protein